MKYKKTNKEIILYEIDKTLTALDNLSNGKNTFHKVLDNKDDFTIWERIVELTKTENKKYLYILPQNGKIDLDVVNNKLANNNVKKENVFIIDLFGTIKNKTNKINTNDFFKLLFNIDGYIKYLNNDIETQRINSLYIDREINILTAQRDFKGKDSEVQTRLNDWALNKSTQGLPILLLGDRGIGKSWVVKKFCINQLKLSSQNPWLYPPAIYINLSFLSDGFSQQASILDAILYHLKNLYKIEMLSDYYIWESFLRTNRIILVLDGFDEMTKEINEEIMYKNLWEIFSIVNKSSKVILTSRTNHFDSKSKILKHFSYVEYIDSTQKYLSDDEIEYSEVGTRIRKNFNIYELTKFEKEDFKDLLIKYGLQKNLVYNHGIKRLKNIKKKAAEWNLEFEIEEISSIPAIYDALIKVLGYPSINLLTAYKSVLLSAIIEYNIDVNRAINYLITIIDKKLKTWDLSAQRKINILSEIAWYMFERDYDFFMFERIPNYIKDKFGLKFELTINDIRTQTVISLFENNRYNFITKGVYAYLVSSYIYELLNDDNIELNYRGIENFGRYDFTKTEIGNRVITFLKEKINNTNGLKQKVETLINNKIDQSEPYAVWLKYLVKNGEKVDIPLLQIKLKDHWTIKPIKFNDNMVLITNKKMLIAKKKIEPFFISINEITNKVFEEFLMDTPEPYDEKEFDQLIEKINEEYPGYFWRRRTDSRQTNISLSDIRLVDNQLWKHNRNPFRSIMNDYHLMLWVNGRPPKNKKDHPVVYVSWFAAVYFCNWLSKRHSLPPFYNFILGPEEGKVVVEKNAQSYGYRLPLASEWKYVAQEGNEMLKFPWDKYKENEILTAEGKKYKQSLLKEQPETYPVRSDEQNNFGVTGLIGNVREWIDRSSVLIVESKKDVGIIKGATWLLGEDGFDFDTMNNVFAENTNLDVGFRIARSLSETEKEIIMKAIS